MSESGGVTVLVVDDNEIKRYTLVRILRQAGFRTLEASTGKEALRLAARKPELILLDVKLPDISGFEVCRTVKADPDLAPIKVLHISATYVDPDHRVEGLMQGADGYLVQPVEPTELVETVKALLRLREAEESARSAARQWRTTFDAIRDGILVMDECHTVLRCNRAMAAILGRTDKEILGLPYEDAFSGCHIDAAPPLAGSGPTSDALECVCDGRTFAVTRNPILDANARVTGSVSVFTDITERKRLEHQLRCRAKALSDADRAKDEFLAMLGHELRNPLGTIANAAALIERHTAGMDSLEKPVNILNRQVRHTSRLVDDLLDISRISRGRLELRMERLDLVAVARRAVEAVQPRMEYHRHTLSLSAPPDPIWLKGDPARLEQVLDNLLDNAAKYTEPGGHVDITVGADAGEAVVRVSDTGSGIDPEMLPRILDLFTQEERSLARSHGGLGIGLALVKNLVEMHGGSVRAESPGRGLGSAFTVCLPLPSDNDPVMVRPAPEPLPAPPPKSILVVDDNVDAAQMLAELLELWGHTVRIAHDGASALEAAREAAPEVVLLDIGLPGMNGYEVAQEMRATVPGMPVLVALTGYGQESDRRRSQAAGFDHHVVKPVPLDALRDILSAPRRA